MQALYASLGKLLYVWALPVCMPTPAKETGYTGGAVDRQDWKTGHPTNTLLSRGGHSEKLCEITHFPVELGGATFSHASLLASEAELSLLRFLHLCQCLDLHSHGEVGAAGAQLNLENHVTPIDTYISSKKKILVTFWFVKNIAKTFWSRTPDNKWCMSQAGLGHIYSLDQKERPITRFDSQSSVLYYAFYISCSILGLKKLR